MNDENTAWMVGEMICSDWPFERGSIGDARMRAELTAAYENLVDSWKAEGERLLDVANQLGADHSRYHGDHSPVADNLPTVRT